VHRDCQEWLHRRDVQSGILVGCVGSFIIGADMTDRLGRLRYGDGILVLEELDQCRHGRDRVFPDQADGPCGVPPHPGLGIARHRQNVRQGVFGLRAEGRDLVEGQHPRPTAVGRGESLPQISQRGRRRRPCRIDSLGRLWRFRLGWRRWLGLGRWWPGDRLRRLSAADHDHGQAPANEESSQRKTTHGTVPFRSCGAAESRGSHGHSGVARFEGPKYTFRVQNPARLIPRRKFPISHLFRSSLPPMSRV